MQRRPSAAARRTACALLPFGLQHSRPGAGQSGPSGQRRECMASRLALTLVVALLLGLGPGVALAQDKVIKMGVIGPLTGDFAFGGQYQLAGAQLKAEELNAQGGGIKVEILSEDDASKCDQSVAAARKLLSRDQIHVLLGAWQSTCTLAIVPLTA